MDSIDSDLKVIRKIFIDIPKQYRLTVDELSKVDREIQDILHVIEFGKIDAIRRNKIFNELRAARITRRKLKDDLLILQKVNGFVEGKVIERELSKLVGDVRSIIRGRKNRRYKLRIRKDLQDVIE